MIYTETGKYALRALLYLGSHAGERGESNGPLPATEIAEAENIPPFYLSKVLKDLVRAGILRSVRGRGGGFQLARPATEISVIDVLEAAEEISRRSQACILGLDACNKNCPCVLHAIWTEFRDALVSRLEDLSVYDLVEEIGLKREAHPPVH